MQTAGEQAGRVAAHRLNDAAEGPAGATQHVNLLCRAAAPEEVLLGVVVERRSEWG